MDVTSFTQCETIPFFQQVGVGDVHEEVQAQFVIEAVIHVFLEKGLIQPQGTQDLRGDSQFLFHLPNNSVLCGFTHFHSPAGKVEVRGALILHGQNGSLGKNHGANTIIEHLVLLMKREIHGKVLLASENVSLE